MIGRIAYYGARAAGRPGGQPRQRPPKQFGVFGKCVCLLIFAAIVRQWWLPILCGTAAMVIVLTLFVLAQSGKAGRR